MSGRIFEEVSFPDGVTSIGIPFGCALELRIHGAAGDDCYYPVLTCHRDGKLKLRSTAVTVHYRAKTYGQKSGFSIEPVKVQSDFRHMFSEPIHLAHVQQRVGLMLYSLPEEATALQLRHAALLFTIYSIFDDQTRAKMIDGIEDPKEANLFNSYWLFPTERPKPQLNAIADGAMAIAFLKAADAQHKKQSLTEDIA